MKRLILIAGGVLTALTLAFAFGSGRLSVDAAASNYEVWVADQGTNQIHVLRPDKGDLEVVETIDYAVVSPLMGVPLSKPHMILFGLHGLPGGRYGYVGNVGSGNASVIDAETRTVVEVIATGARTHAVQPSPDGARALALALGPAGCTPASAVCGQVAEIITDTANAQFTLKRTFKYSDLDAESQEKLPNFNPVCGSFTPDSRYFYVTFASGGLAVFEVNADPEAPLFNVIAVFAAGTGANEVAANGCGIGYSVDGRLMFANSATEAQSFYYVFDIGTHTMIHSQDVSGVVGDVHGMMLHPDGKDVVMAGRLTDNFIVLNQKTGQLRTNKTFSAAPGDAPDLTDFSPDGKWLYVTMRGPIPATGTHSISGETPGVLVVKFAAGKVEGIVPLPGTGDQDPHGIAVRRLN